MNKFFKLGFIFLLIFGTFGLFGKSVQADETAEGYSISIVKYRLEDPQIVENQLPLDGTKAGEVKDTNGKTLEPLKGVSYEITRVSPVQGTTDFEPVIGDSAFSTTVTTDDAGLARVTNLAQGTYRVVEKDHELLKKPMEPVILELPLPQRTGEALNEVYLYPKSSVITKSDSPGGTIDKTKGVGTRNATGKNERLPQTSGNIGSYHSLLLVLSFILIMTLIGFRVMKTKKFDF
ncbi:pilin N-terminal domain-containing protein [Enterococcus sp. AZ196]|uniref:pilin N-terminal domain-containing protein n=1 Tax=Enterococcus sp. AZ196 TaxID=2774659 RepID=UPI003D29B94F